MKKQHNRNKRNIFLILFISIYVIHDGSKKYKMIVNFTFIYKMVDEKLMRQMPLSIVNYMHCIEERPNNGHKFHIEASSLRIQFVTNEVGNIHLKL